jgi:hypothetical protein
MMFDKFFDLKGDALEEKRERIKLGEIAHCYKLRFEQGYIVTSMSKEVHAKLFAKGSPVPNKKVSDNTIQVIDK